ncbi:MAG: DUF1015 domain-containing protein [Saprospiraceae bacterium]|nr:DUF1015 domain-containing protein [Saprospiraceae bacterium]
MPSSILFPNFDRIEPSSHFFADVKYDFLPLYENDYFKPNNRPAIYIYRIDTQQRFYQGITAAVPIEAYWKGDIKGHEGTLEMKEKQQLDLLKERKAQIKPVLLTYATVPAIENWILKQQSNRPFIHFKQGENKHTIWEVHQAEQIADIQQLFAEQVVQTYIADGHHRTTITAKYAEEIGQPLHLYCTLFSSSQVEILSFNRVVEGIPERNLEGLIKHLSNWCMIEPSKISICQQSIV